jgi:AcrR family transcriptional regulator
MARWEPDARGRLAEAAMALYLERGYDETTVADIAESAGLTERTFFRHFADKREVLFWGAHALETLVVDSVLDAPAGLRPLAVVSAAFEATAPLFEERRAFAGKRQRLLAAHAELQERELIKLESLASAVAGALRRRGVRDLPARLTANAGIAIFTSGFELWLADAKKRDLAHHVRTARGELEAVASAGAHAKAPRSKRPRTR